MLFVPEQLVISIRFCIVIRKDIELQPPRCHQRSACEFEVAWIHITSVTRAFIVLLVMNQIIGDSVLESIVHHDPERSTGDFRTFQANVRPLS